MIICWWHWRSLHIHDSDLLVHIPLWISRVKIMKSLEMADHWMVTWSVGTAQLLLRFPRTEHFETIEFYSKDGVKLAIHQCHLGRDCILIYSCLLGHTALQVSGAVLGIWSQRVHNSVVTLWGETKMVAFVVSWDRGLHVSRVILVRWSCNGRTLGHFTGDSA